MSNSYISNIRIIVFPYFSYLPGCLDNLCKMQGLGLWAN